MGGYSPGWFNITENTMRMDESASPLRHRVSRRMFRLEQPIFTFNSPRHAAQVWSQHFVKEERA